MFSGWSIRTSDDGCSGERPSGLCEAVTGEWREHAEVVNHITTGRALQHRK